MAWLFGAGVATQHVTLPIARSSAGRLYELCDEPECALVVAVVAGLLVGLLLLVVFSGGVLLLKRITSGVSARRSQCSFRARMPLRSDAPDQSVPQRGAPRTRSGLPQIHERRERG